MNRILFLALKPIFVALIVAFAFYLLQAVVYAAGTGLSITPVKVSHTINPGEAASGIITLKNSGANKINVDVKVEDFIHAAGSSNIKFVGRAEGLTTVRDWITLDIPEQFTFEQGEKRDIKYTIQAPPNAEPGSHFGVAFFRATEFKEGQQLKIGTRVGMLIFVTVPGNFLQKGNIIDFAAPRFLQKGPVDFDISFENTGTVHFEPKGEITITNLFGNEVGVVPVQGQAVLPTGSRILDATWVVSGFLLGKYTAVLSIKDAILHVSKPCTTKAAL